MGLPYLTRLVVSARYMVTLNVETTDGLVNGSLGILKKLSYSSMSDGTRIPTTAWIDCGYVYFYRISSSLSVILESAIYWH
jgi:hypothetical protein